jgi:hypothetical protein
MTAENHVFDPRPAVAYVNDIQKSVSVESAKHWRGENPDRGTAISYWLKSPAPGEVRITISDVTGRQIRQLEGPNTAGLHRVQWNLVPGGAGRGRQGGAGQQEAGTPGTPGVAAGTGGQQQTARPPAQPQRGGAPQAAQPAQPQQAQQFGRGGGRGRGGGGTPVPAGTYLVKVMVGDKVIGQKTVTVEADTTFMQ